MAPVIPVLAGVLIVCDLFAHAFYGAWMLDQEGW